MKKVILILGIFWFLVPAHIQAQLSLSREMKKAQNLHRRALRKQSVADRDKAAAAYLHILKTNKGEGGCACKLLGELYSFHAPQPLQNFALSLKYYAMADSLIEEQSYKESLGNSETEALNDKANVLYNLGIFYYRGAGVPQDFGKAKEFWIRSARLNDKYLVGLGEMYELGLGETQNLNKAMEYYYRSALTGNDTWAKIYSMKYVIDGMADSTLDLEAYRLYEKYMYVTSVNDDSSGAFEYIVKAAKKGFLPAECELSGLYASGIGTSPNFNDALYWARLAAEKGYVPAMNNYAFLLEMGNNNFGEALRWYVKAAEEGLPLAQAAVGYYYQHGLGGAPRDYERAASYYQYSADQGCQLGRTRLAELPQFVKSQQFTEKMNNLSNTLNTISNILVHASQKYQSSGPVGQATFKTDSPVQNNNSADFWVSEYYKYEQKVKKEFEYCLNTAKSQKTDFTTSGERLFSAYSRTLKVYQAAMKSYRQYAAECGKKITPSKWETEDVIGLIRRELR